MLLGIYGVIGFCVGLYFLFGCGVIYLCFFEDLMNCCCVGQVGVGCLEGCWCEGCMNKYGRKEGLIFILKNFLLLLLLVDLFGGIMLIVGVVIELMFIKVFFLWIVVE